MKKISFVKIKNKNIYETTRWVWIIYPLNYLKRRSKYPNKIISKIKQYLQDDNASMNIPSKHLRRWSKIKKKNSQNEIEKCFTKSKQEYTNNIIRDDNASMNIPSKPLRRWSKIKKK
jgi:hypoxanthine phosphoribosyltransferase